MSGIAGGAESAPLLKTLGLTKAFGATVALESFDFTLMPGQIHALIGENGAGKVNLHQGACRLLHRPDFGTMDTVSALVAAVRRSLSSTRMLGLVPGMSVAENILLGSAYPRRAGLIDWRKVSALARESLARVGAAFDPGTIVDRLGTADRALVAIARGIRMKARILVLDEPTAMLPGNDVDKLFEVLRRGEGRRHRHDLCQPSPPRNSRHRR